MLKFFVYSPQKIMEAIIAISMIVLVLGIVITSYVSFKSRNN